jgi:hypothetical protein
MLARPAPQDRQSLLLAEQAGDLGALVEPQQAVIDEHVPLLTIAARA